MRLRTCQLIAVVAIVVAGAFSGVAPASAATTSGTDANGVTYSYDPADVAAGASVTGFDSSFTGTGLTIPDDVEFNAVSYPVTRIASNAFNDASRFTSLALGSNLTTIGNWAFYNAGTFDALVIPDSVTTIGHQSFRRTGTTSLTLGSSVTTIGDYAFSYNALGAVTIPDSVTSIGEHSFQHSHVTGLTLGSSVVSIGTDAFDDNDLGHITIPDSVTTIGDTAFNNAGVTALTLGSSVATIGDAAFSGNGFASIVIPASVTAIGTEAFSDGPLTSVTFEGAAPAAVAARGDHGSFGDLSDSVMVNFGCAFADPDDHDPAFTGGTWQGYPSQAVDDPTVTFDANGQSGVTSSSAVVTCGGSPTAPALPDGLSWYVDSGLTTLFDPGATYADTTAYAGPSPTAPTLSYPDSPQLSVGIPGSIMPTVTGQPSPSFSLADGSVLPDGLSLNAATGEISGTPPAGTEGTHSVTVTASNGVADPVSTTVELTVALPTQSDAHGFQYRYNPTDVAAGATVIGFDGVIPGLELTIPDTVEFDGVTYAVTGIGANAFRRLDLTTVAIPASVTTIGGSAFEDLFGRISVTFAGAAPSGFVARTDDPGSLGPDATVVFSCRYAEPGEYDPAFTTSGSWQGYPASANDDPVVTFDANGRPGVTTTTATVACGATPKAADLPEGLGWYADSGLITPYEPGAVYTDTTLYAGEATMPSLTYPSVTFTVGTETTMTPTVTGTPTPALALTDGSVLPAGLSFDTSTGAIAGTPGAGTAGIHRVSIVATNGVGDPVTVVLVLTVVEQASLNGPDTAAFTVGEDASWVPELTGYPAPTVLAIGLPDGLSIDPTTGEISGVPAIGADGIHRVTVTAGNGVSDSVSFVVAVTVNPAPPITFVLRTDRDTYQPGDTVIISGSGLPAGTTVALSLHSAPIPLGTATAAADGSFVLSIGLPALMDPGAHSIVATVEVWGTASTQSLPVTIAPASTGDDGSTGGGGLTGSVTDGAGGPGGWATSGDVTWGPGPGLAATGAGSGLLIAGWLALLLLASGVAVLGQRGWPRRRH